MAELSHKKTTDVLVVTDHFLNLALGFPCKNQSMKHVVPLSMGIRFSAFMGSPKESIQAKEANFESPLLKDLHGHGRCAQVSYEPISSHEQWNNRKIQQNSLEE